jgi:hypothetical protein
MFISEVRIKKESLQETYYAITFVNVNINVDIFREHVIFGRLAREMVDRTRYDLQTGVNGGDAACVECGPGCVRGGGGMA